MPLLAFRDPTRPRERRFFSHVLLGRHRYRLLELDRVGKLVPEQFLDLKPILANAALPSIRWYDLRHTTASLLLHSGTNPKIVAEKLGHSSVNLTLNVYSHTIPSMQHDAAQTLENALAG